MHITRQSAVLIPTAVQTVQQSREERRILADTQHRSTNSLLYYPSSFGGVYQPDIKIKYDSRAKDAEDARTYHFSREFALKT